MSWTKCQWLKCHWLLCLGLEFWGIGWWQMSNFHWVVFQSVACYTIGTFKIAGLLLGAVKTHINSVVRSQEAYLLTWFWESTHSKQQGYYNREEISEWYSYSHYSSLRAAVLCTMTHGLSWPVLMDYPYTPSKICEHWVTICLASFSCKCRFEEWHVDARTKHHLSTTRAKKYHRCHCYP